MRSNRWLRVVPALIFATGCVGGDVTGPDAQADGATPLDSGGDAGASDAGTDASVADTGADSGTPQPDVIFGSNLVLWLDADQPGTVQVDANNRVITWKDRTTNANNGTLVYSNAQAHVDLKKNAQNGHAALAFSGTWNATGAVKVADSLSLQFGTGDFLIVEIVAYNNTPGTDEYGGRGQLWAKATGGWPYWGSGLAANAFAMPLPDGGAGGADSVIFGGVKSFADGPTSGAWSSKNGWNDGAFHAFALRKDGAGKHAYVRTDGAETPSPQPIDTTQNLSAMGGDVMIAGGVVNGTCCYDPLKGYIAEVIAVKGSSGTLSELNQLSAYVKAKYALAF